MLQEIFENYRISSNITTTNYPESNGISIMLKVSKINFGRWRD